MRVHRALGPLTLALILAVPLAAQNAQCNALVLQADRNVCNAAIDGTRVFHPVAGLLVSGGDAVLGSFRSLGGFPHLSVTVRVNATKLKTPDLGYDGTTGTTVPTADEITAPAPLVEAAVGVFNGVGESHFLSIDALGSAQLLPVNAVDNLTVDDNARKIGDIALGLGFGGRVGITSGKGLVPAIAVSAMYRSIPKITYGDVPSGDQYSFGVDLKATNLRATAGYKFALLQVGAGLGWDKYTGDASLQYRTSLGTQNARVDLDASRTLAFVGAGLDLPIVKLGAELGYQFGKDEKLSTTFQDNDPGDNRLFGSVGIRFGF